MDDLLNTMYPEKNLGTVLKSLNISLDEVSLIPFQDGKTLIADLSGNTKGFITENVHGGIDVTDANMNKIGSVHEHGGVSTVYDSNMQQVGTIQENQFGGTNLYQDGQLELVSTENIFFGQDYYDQHMQFLGSSNEFIDKKIFAMKEETVLPEYPEVASFSDTLPDMSVGLDSLDILTADALELFDIFDLFL